MRSTCLILISLIFTIFLLTPDLYPCLAGEFNLSSALGVKIPEAQSANPGDFVTYVLQLTNHSKNPLSLETTYSAPPHWNVLGDNVLTIPFQNNPVFFPITVQIPGNALADSEATIKIQLKLKDGPELPVLIIPVKVNPVSAIAINVPQSVNASFGTTAAYTVTVTNRGNTGEQFRVGCSSENDWRFEVVPKIFQLAPGQSQEVHVTHQVPPYTDLGSDQLTLTFSWSSRQQVATLTTRINNLTDSLSQRFYPWQGQISLYHPNLTDFNTYPSSGAFSLQGQLGPDSSAQIYASDIFDPNRSRYMNLKYGSWNSEVGSFPLTWPGLISPASLNGTLLLSDRRDDGVYSLYSWNTSQPGASTPIGLEINLPDQAYRLLHQTLSGDLLNVAEWEYRSKIRPELEWTHILAYNLSNPINYGYSLGLQGEAGAWYWSSAYQSIQNYLTYPFKNGFSLSWGQNGSPKVFDSDFQLKYNFGTSSKFYQDYSFSANLKVPPELRIILSDQYHLLDGILTGDSATIYLESQWNTEYYEHNWWLNYSLDHDIDGTTSYAKLYWLTDYAYNEHEDLLFNPQLIATSLPSTNDDSKLGLGYHREWLYGPDLTIFGYVHLNSSTSWSSDIELAWKIYEYTLTFNFSGSWREGRLATDVCSLILNQNFILPLKKPLGTIDGLVYLDRNRNGIHDSDDPPAGNVSFCLDGESVRFSTDSQGRFQISGLDPGEHLMMLDSKYEAVYQTRSEKTLVTVKAYQDAKVKIPLTRTENLTGIIYRDQNLNGNSEPGEPGLTGIPVILCDRNGHEIDRTISGENGSFNFYQLEQEIYQIRIDPDALPDDLQLPPQLLPVSIDMSSPEAMPFLKIGLLPYQKPIEMVTVIQPLTLTVDPEMGYIGDTIKVSVECQVPLAFLELQFPDDTVVRIKTSGSDNHYLYSWKISKRTPYGQVKIYCRTQGLTAQGLDDATFRTEANLIILKRSDETKQQYP